MKTLSFLVLICSFFLYSQKYHSLDGIENQQGETILLYRLGSEFFYYNPVIKFNTSTLSENQVISAYYFHFPQAEQAKTVHDFEFFSGDENNFVNTGFTINPDGHYYIARNDSPIVWDLGNFARVDISKQDPMKIFAFSGYATARSFDGGYSYPPDSVLVSAGFGALSVADYDDNIFFGVDEELRFVRNGELVDTSKVFFDEYFKMMYDKDSLYVYRLNRYYGSYTFNVSNNKGNAYTWSMTYQSEDPFYVICDAQTSGELYLADANAIYKSADHGYSFSRYRNLPYRITGLYKKPGSNILYASTVYKIFKITPDTAYAVKTISRPDVFDWFPLEVGNVWVYNFQWLNDYCWPDTTFVETSVIKSDTVMFEKKYFVFEPPLAQEYNYLRIDSAEAKLKSLSHSFPQDSTEYTIYDFYMEPGDTVIFDPEYPYGGFYLESEDSIHIFSSQRPKRNLQALSFLPPSFSLVKGIGYYQDAFCEFGGWKRVLKGCVLNGTVYGDTTLTGVDDFLNQAPSQYNLYQNYPNPFNPVTTIRYSLPAQSHVVIKIFDVLGNEIKNLVDEEKPGGSYEITWNADQLPSGIYFYQLKAMPNGGQAGIFIETGKMILMK